MNRLNQRAFEILKAEVERCASEDAIGKVQQEIALKRLQKLRSQKGSPASLEELRDTVDDLFPTFSRKVLKIAAQANNPGANPWNRIKLAAIATAGIVGGIWVLNLPYPPIRYPVSRIAPILLLPSFISMDYNYRQAIALTEQADQLVNQTTSPADLELGSTKVKAAQKHLDALPVWFLGYYPQAYCGWFGCSWRFTLDEFQQARKEVARMDARLFQEKNAQDQLNQADQAIGNAKQQYQETSNDKEKQAAIAQWQQGMDQMQQIPRETLAGRMAQTKLQAYERDFQQVSGLSAGSTRTGTLVDAAKEFAKAAEQFAPDKPHSAEEWQQIQGLWEQAIAELQKVTDKDPNYVESRKLLAAYEVKLRQTRIRLTEEQQATQAYDQAQKLTENLLAEADTANRNQVISQFQAIQNQLDKVKPRTTVYDDAQMLRKNAGNGKQKQLRGK